LEILRERVALSNLESRYRSYVFSEMMPKLWNETIEAHCRVDLGSISQEQDVVARWKFFIRAGIDDIRVFPFDADDACAAWTADLQLADRYIRQFRWAHNRMSFKKPHSHCQC